MSKSSARALSPANFPSNNEPNIKKRRKKLQLMNYRCLHKTWTRKQLYKTHNTVLMRCMKLLCKRAKQKRKEDRKILDLQNQIAALSINASQSITEPEYEEEPMEVDPNQ